MFVTDRRWPFPILAVAVAVAVFDPGGNLLPGVKYGLMLFLALLAIVVWFLDRWSPRSARASVAVSAYVLAFSVVLPLYGILMWVMRADPQGNSWSIYLGSHVYLILLVSAALVLVSYRQLEVAVMASLTALAALIVLLYLSGFIIDPALINRFGFRYELLAYSVRQYGPLSVPYVYYFTSPMLALVGGYWAWRASRPAARPAVWLGFLGVVIAMVLSGTRANLAAAVLIVAVFVWWRSKVSFFALGTAGAFTLFFLGPVLLSLVSTSSGATGHSNSVKVSYLAEYNELWSDPLGLLFGYGLGSCIDRADLHVCIPLAELTYFELVRMFGLVGAAAYLALLAIPLIGNLTTRPGIALGYGAYLMVGFVNPYLFSTNGMIVLAVALMSTAVPPRPIAPERVFNAHRDTEVSVPEACVRPPAGPST